MFDTKTWLNRISEYANRRKLTDDSGTTSIVTVERYEGSIQQEGDAFNAENMNDLESRISASINSLDESISSEISSRTSADEELKSSISTINANLTTSYATKTYVNEQITAQIGSAIGGDY